MPDRSSKDKRDAVDAAGFGPTSWTLICAARDADLPERQAALEQLCQTYWYPLYAFVRRHGHRPEDAEDLTQSFFSHLLKRNFLGAVDRRKGKFRSFLLASLKYFLENERQYRAAAKRGGGRTVISLEQCMEDRFAAEPASEQPPESLFDRDWAVAVMDRVGRRMQVDYARSGKASLFERLRPLLTDESSMSDYESLAAAMNMTANAVAIALHRLRHRYRDTLRDEIMQTVSNAEEAGREMDYLMEIMGSMS
jgi:RNA polymerase sigma-70 factor (ECF subfamily)